MLHFFLHSRTKHFKLINSTVYVTVPCRNQMFEHNATCTVLLNFHKWWGSYVLHRCMNIYEAFMSPALLFKKICNYYFHISQKEKHHQMTDS